MGKEYVPVLLHVTKDGEVIPKQFKGGVYGEWVKILKVTDSRRRASLRAGAVGMRYTCTVSYNEERRNIYLFDEGQKWFIEVEDIDA